MPKSPVQTQALSGLLPDFERLNFAIPPKFGKSKTAEKQPLASETPGIIFSRASSGQGGLEWTPGRRAPKVTVTRERVSLCQKGVTLWLLFMVN